MDISFNNKKKAYARPYLLIDKYNLCDILMTSVLDEEQDVDVSWDELW